MSKSYHVIVIDGVIGAGKSTLLGLLTVELTKKGHHVCAVPEPVHLWGEILPIFYADPVRWGYSFQTLVYVTRIQAIRDAVIENPHADIFLLERSPVSDRVFMELQRQNVTPVETAMYEMWADGFDAALPISLAEAMPVYLAPTLPTCMARVAHRARTGEKVSQGFHDYQARLHRAYLAMYGLGHEDEFPSIKRAPFHTAPIIIEGDLAAADWRERPDVLAQIIAKLGL